MGRRPLAVLTVSILLGVACGDAGPTDGSAPSATAAVQPPATTPSVPNTSPTRPGSLVTTGATTTAAAAEPAETTTTVDGGEVMEKQPPSTTEPPSPPSEAVGSAGVGDSFYPLLGNGGYDVIHYDIALDVDLATNTIDATTTLTAVAAQDLASFNLDLSGLEVEAVDVDGEIATFSREGSEMTVRPPAIIREGDRFSVSVVYSGTPEPIADPGVPFERIGWRWTEGVIYTINEPSGAMSWFPGNNHPSDKATFVFRITVPTGTTAAATGVLEGEVAEADRTTVTWRMDDPMATYLAAVYVGDFERRESVGPNGLLIRHYLPPDIDPASAEALYITADVIRYYERILGPYPFDAYGAIVMPFDLGFALENQTLSIHGTDSLAPYTVAHEIMHQWFGNSATLDDWSDIWLLEGFATYLPLMYGAEAHGIDPQPGMTELYNMVRAVSAPPPKGIEHHDLFDFPAVYARGALVLHALRTEVGEATFLDILRTHYEATAGSTTNTESFLEVVQELAGDAALEVARSWLFDTDVPDAPWAAA